ncbi:MAG: efflux RND transporter periplasmic adaptor subunit [Bacteroidia bacterium]|nr:efflux RND transporter periplasmic adaptor subunit [Bacteroidia bacterium]
MKKKSNSLKILVLINVLLAFTYCKKTYNSSNIKKEILYQCPMDTQIISKVQGKCPICKMKLEFKADDAVLQSISPSKLVFSSQKTIKITDKNISSNIILSGITALAENLNKNVSAKFGGRIEKLYVKYNYKYVNEGDKIMEIFNPELLAMQEEYLFLLKTKNEKIFIEKSRKKLLLSNISESQIVEIEKTHKVKRTITIYSPYSGFVFFNDINKATADNETAQSDGMNMSKTIVEEPTYNYSKIYEGSYVNNRSTLFQVNDMSKIWAWISVPAMFIEKIIPGTPVDLALENNSLIKTKIDLIDRNNENGQSKFAKFKITLDNFDNKILINAIVKATVKSSINNKIYIPQQSIYFTGKNSIVWLKTANAKNGNVIFEIKKIITGEKIDGNVEVISGLNVNDEIAANAGMMTDSETILE